MVSIHPFWPCQPFLLLMIDGDPLVSSFCFTQVPLGVGPGSHVVILLEATKNTCVAQTSRQAQYNKNRGLWMILVEHVAFDGKLDRGSHDS